MLRSPGGLRPHFMGRCCCRQRSKTSLTPITSSTTYSNHQHKPALPPQRKNMIVTRGSTTTRRLVTKTGPLCPSPISGHTDSYRHSLGPTVVTKALYHLLRPLITYPNLLSLLQQITHSCIILLLSLITRSPKAYSLIPNTSSSRTYPRRGLAS